MEEKKLIDDCFYVQKGKFLWDSYDLEGKGLVSALTEEQCISGMNMRTFTQKIDKKDW